MVAGAINLWIKLTQRQIAICRPQAAFDNCNDIDNLGDGKNIEDSLDKP